MRAARSGRCALGTWCTKNAYNNVSRGRKSEKNKSQSGIECIAIDPPSYSIKNTALRRGKGCSVARKTRFYTPFQFHQSHHLPFHLKFEVHPGCYLAFQSRVTSSLLCSARADSEREARRGLSLQG